MLFYTYLLLSPSSISPTPSAPPASKKLFGSAQIPRPNTAGAGWAHAHPPVTTLLETGLQSHAVLTLVHAAETLSISDIQSGSE